MLNRKSESKYIAENGSYDRGDTVDRILGLTTIEGDRCFVVEWYCICYSGTKEETGIYHSPV
jgi:hypothetical protein